MHTKMFHKERKPIKRKFNIVRTNNLFDKNITAVRMIKKTPKKRTDRAKAKDKAWNAFSLYVRTRDCIRFTGNPNEGMCVTCKGKFPRIKLQAGHFVGGRGNSVLFNEQIVYSQCGHCNQKPPMGLGGNYAAYTLFMFDEGYTRQEIESFLALKGKIKQYKTNDFREIEAEYKEKLKALLAE